LQFLKRLDAGPSRFGEIGFPSAEVACLGRKKRVTRVAQEQSPGAGCRGFLSLEAQ
jgi:hypothetical protein